MSKLEDGEMIRLLLESIKLSTETLEHCKSIVEGEALVLLSKLISSNKNLIEMTEAEL